jgi:hypothetical protein
MKWMGGEPGLLALLALAMLALALPAALRSQSLPAAVARQRNQLLHEEWDPARLYAVLSSQDMRAIEDLYRAAFGAGPAIIPKLENALKDDRTAEFAAQTLAYLGGERPLAILSKLVNDPRDLDLRRFYYGALGAYRDPHDVEILLNQVRTSDHEPDREVTQNAILALSISSDAALVSRLRQAEKQVTDPVIQDDLQTAAMVVGLRARYGATSSAKDAASSVELAIRGYFMPALQATPGGVDAGQPPPGVEVNVRSRTSSPDKTRVLAAVDFENPEAVASYHMVLQKDQSGWKVASVWLGEEREKPQTPDPQK